MAVKKPRNQVRAVRERRGKSQEWLGEQLGITSQAVSRLEAEDSRINLPRLEELSRILGVSIAVLVNEAPLDELAEDAAGYRASAALDRARLIAVTDALDHFLAKHRLRIVPGARGELIAEIYDWSVASHLSLDRPIDLAPIAGFLMPRFEQG